MLQYFAFAILFLIGSTLQSTDAKLSKLSALRQNIFHGYDNLVKPDDQVIAMLGITLLNLEICPHKQVMAIEPDKKFTSWVQASKLKRQHQLLQ